VDAQRNRRLHLCQEIGSIQLRLWIFPRRTGRILGARRRFGKLRFYSPHIMSNVRRFDCRGLI
jgi:hypothetical protein